MQVLLLRFKAPLMSFGAEDSSEELGPTMRHPGLSMIAGLIANAHGWDHADAHLTQKIQDGIAIASLELTRGEVETDHQAIRLSKKDSGFQTEGGPMERAGHEYSYRGALRRWKDYIADGEYAVAIAATDPEISLAGLAEILKRPLRPVFLGRKCCLPSAPLVIGLVEAASLVDALKGLRAAERPTRKCHARWPAALETPEAAETMTVADCRDWTSRVHGGERRVAEGLL